MDITRSDLIDSSPQEIEYGTAGVSSEFRIGHLPNAKLEPVAEKKKHFVGGDAPFIQATRKIKSIKINCCESFLTVIPS